MTNQSKYGIYEGLGISLLCILTLLSLLVGVQELKWIDLFSLNSTQQNVLLNIRIPRTISLILSGSTLAVSGLLMQQLTQNKFVSPTTAGTMSSARLGVILSMIFFSTTSFFERILFAFMFSIVGTVAFMLFLKVVKKSSSIMIPLVGMMFGNVINSIGVYIALKYEVVQNASSWLQGNFSLVSSKNYLLIYLSIPVLFLIYLFAHYFTIMAMGEAIASELGIAYNMIEFIGIIIVSLATTAVLLTVGTIPFVGIIIPNLIALKYGDNFKRILFPTFLFGAVFTLFCDILARSLIVPYEIPISVVIGIFGSAVFLFLLLRGEEHG